MDNYEKLLLPRVTDLFNQCKKQCVPKFSAFLDGGAQAAISDNAYPPYDLDIEFFGGYDGAERKMLGVFPEWEEDRSFPISVIKAESKYIEGLSHRDFLGALMSQGVDRGKTGDILIGGNAAYIFVCTDIASYFTNNISKIGNRGVKLTICSVGECELPVPKTENKKAVCASSRLDAVLAPLCGISRSASSKLISSGGVKVNHREILNVSYSVKPGDLLSVRGYGRFLFVSFDGETGGGRVHITAKKYI